MRFSFLHEKYSWQVIYCENDWVHWIMDKLKLHSKYEYSLQVIKHCFMRYVQSLRSV